MGGYTVEPAELAAARAYVDAAGARLAGELERLDARFQAVLGPLWFGAAAGSFATAWAECTAGASAVVMELADLGARLGNASRAYSSTEAEVATTVRRGAGERA